MDGKLINLNNGVFEISAVRVNQYPKTDGPPLPEIALVGRSNVGKSCLLNCLANRRDLARTSSRPGRTQTINFYRFPDLRVVDLPGYGYAQVAKRVRAKWGPMIETYLREREQLIGVLHIVDLRHKPTSDDELMARWLQGHRVPCVVVATKADKISRGRWPQHAKVTKETLGVEPIVFSAQSGIGKEAVLRAMTELIISSF
ncbi:MAG: YihA family ribosome biogenesis GTP-binding protein [Firmicutes bacterium]|jgi:GTP-binding protein|nr:YihA family ribosome biogenesis GTP-binding protein [Bacillota bacterium]